jgi:hypothetical protein
MPDSDTNSFFLSGIWNLEFDIWIETDSADETAQPRSLNPWTATESFP